MKENIIVLGSGQHARVVLYNIAEQDRYNVAAFLDADFSKVGQQFEGIQIVGDYSPKSLEVVRERYKTNKFFIGFGNMAYRKIAFQTMVDNGWEAVNIIHPNAVISPQAKIGDGVLIECGCLITPNPVIGDNVVVNTGTQVNHDNLVEDHVYLASGVVLSGGVTIKENTLIDDGVIVTLGHAVGSCCVIGAGSVVTKDIEDGVIAYGNPCKVVRTNK
ncbi:hypothetical protein Ami103574_01985 [Aminipila butyrica]|uniref:PglD N-terminal domain-containing protein n=1 Tax=Aminipila butyrica TaxID=433296 RepID=A0A858BS42_9FIRM|nr:NeuD/PglB/VioB family sugar acetyltransferase [Aminipila butyrica]QIB68152.1 hypothetical protein Ami103574_01985 [Aminipila butyrica]